MDAYEILGRQIVNEVMGADAFDLSSLVSAAAELSQKGIATYEQHKAGEKTKAEQSAALAKAIAADAAWANAEQMVELTKGDAAASALQASASQEAMSAGAGLSADSTSKRVAAANKAAKEAAQDSLAHPQDKGKSALMRAWQKVASRAAVSPMSDSGGGFHGKGSGGTSFFMTKHAGIPTWGWLAGGAVVTTGLILLLRSKRK